MMKNYFIGKVIFIVLLFSATSQAEEGTHVGSRAPFFSLQSGSDKGTDNR